MLPEEDSTRINHKEKHTRLDWQTLRTKSLQPGGFGEERVTIWPKLLNVSDTKPVIDKKPLIGPVEEEKPPHQDERQIGLDTDRSFVLYPVDLKYDRETLQAGLHELLVSVFRKRPRLSYFQGYHDIVTVFFLTLPQDLQFACVEKLSLHRVRDSMGSGLEPIIGLLRVTKNLLHLVDPDYTNVLQQSSSLPFYALPNLLTLFAHDMPTLPLIQHVFDYLLCRPPIAAVYLAAAIILSRKEEVLHLDEEGEEGMIHSLLSSLPNIADDALDEEESVAEDLTPLKGEESLNDPDKTFFKEETAPDGHVDGALDQVLNHAKTESERHEPPVNDQEQALKPLDSDKVPLQQDHSEDEATSSPKISETSPEHSKADSASGEHILDMVPEVPASDPTSNITVKLEDDDDILPACSTCPKLPKLFLTDLLKHADALYSAFPPGHPGLSLSSIMGPQSVVFTWSESPSSLPSDNTAEAMVSCPDLVVYPFIETDSHEMKSKESSEAEEKIDKKARRKRHRLRKSPFSHVEKKTMVAGTVIVLGVAMAIYGVKVSRDRSGHGIFHSFAEGHGHTGTKDWRRLGGWVGGAVTGMTTKIMNGLSSTPR
ncbi:hypothetical protein BYT27DRAFT_7160272 [Phlegmacium glaucopus]|nr:hypothetical protein BYT27DRAFT_7160272 [Phlegmacium glaucopus]